jgi:DNA-binding HxlR family transcriptional regulator
MSSSTAMSATPLHPPRTPLDEQAVAALQQAVSVLAAKWSVLVLARLADGTHRFNELLRQIDGVSRRMLSATLRQLERDGLIERHVYPSRVPVRVEYELSTAGIALLSALTPLAGWGLDHADDLAAARVQFERLQARRAESQELQARSQSTPRIV